MSNVIFCRISELVDNERALRNKLDLVTQREIRAQDNLALVAEERARRISVLQRQLHEVECSNEQLNDSIEQLKQIEQYEHTEEQMQVLYIIMFCYTVYYDIVLYIA